MGNSHIGPVAQIVFNAYNCISCSQQTWQNLYTTLFDNIERYAYEIDFMSTDLDGLYKEIYARARNLNYSAGAIFDFHSNITRNIDQLVISLYTFNDTLEPMDTYVQNTINELTIETYDKCINGISRSINQNFSCVSDIIEAQSEIFTAFQIGIQNCSTTPVVLDLRSNLFKAFQIIRNDFSNMKQCLSAVRLSRKTKSMLQTPGEICLDNVSFFRFKLIEDF